MVVETLGHLGDFVVALTRARASKSPLPEAADGLVQDRQRPQQPGRGRHRQGHAEPKGPRAVAANFFSELSAYLPRALSLL